MSAELAQDIEEITRRLSGITRPIGESDADSLQDDMDDLKASVVNLTRVVGKLISSAEGDGEITVTLPKRSLATAAKVLASIDGGECYKPRDVTQEAIHEAAHDLEAAASELES